jgi:predicted acetyltransferase
MSERSSSDVNGADPGVTLEPIARADKPVVARLYQLYLHDQSEFSGIRPGVDGLYAPSQYFDAYWEEAVRHPFFILYRTDRVGFALVREREPKVHSIAEFFILRSARRMGMGRAAATALFERYPGEWGVAQEEHNLPAQAFWRSVIGAYTNGDYSEGLNPDQPRGPAQRFVSG